MECARCGAELLEGKRFCHQCGAAAQTRCPHCGAATEPRFRFCPDCGGSLHAEKGTAAPAPAEPIPAATREAPPPRSVPQVEGIAAEVGRIPEDLARKIRGAEAAAGERKQVTVLFCDLTGSTRLAEALDPEDYRELLDHYLELVFAEIYRYEGIVNQLAGDGLMALFGAPIAHEDAPARALRAALAIQAALSGDDRLRARIGVHTGPVVVGTVGNDLKMDYTAIGDTTNLAARLQSLAAPGTILASEATERLVRGGFEVEAEGPLEVRGKSEPVRAFRVLRACEHTSPIALARARGLTPWVGRDPELAQLRDCFERLDGSLPQFASVIGEPGSGKSRLLYEFRRSLEPEDALVFEGRCAALTQSVPFALWNGLLRDFFALRGDESPEVARKRIAERIETFDPGLAPVIPYLCAAVDVPCAELTDATGEDRRRGTFDAVTRLVVSGAQRGRVVMILEDLHWIDEPSRESLERAVAELDAARVMILVSHRPDYQPSWKVRVAFTQLHLRPLRDEHARAIVRHVAGGALPPELEKRILRRAEGNPFFAEEVTRALVEGGALERMNGGVRTTRPVHEVQIPDTVQELVGARLDRLPAAAKRVAQVAAVFGRQFDRDELAWLMQSDGSELDASLGLLEERGIVYRQDLERPKLYRFGESFTQEVAYESLLLRERRALHARITELLEEQAKTSASPRFALLAHHYARSDDRERAVGSLLAAAERAADLPSYPQALQLYGDAWKLAEMELDREAAGPEVFRRAALQATQGLLRVMLVYGSGSRHDPVRIAKRGGQLARALADSDAQADMLGLLGLVLASSDGSRFEEALQHVREGYALAEREGHTLRATALTRVLAYLYVLDGRFADAFPMLRTSIAALEAQGHAAARSDLFLGARYFYDRARLLASDLDGVAADVAETYEMASEASNRTVQSGSAATRAWLHYLHGEHAAAADWADHALEIADEIGNTAAVRNAAAVALGARTALGAQGATPRYLEIFDRKTSRGGEAVLSSLVSVEALLAFGDVDRARRAAELAMEIAGGRLGHALATCAMGVVLLRLGSEHWLEAERLLERALDAGRSLGVSVIEVASLLGLAELAHARGEERSAEARAGEALERAESAHLARYALRARCLLDPECRAVGAEASARP